MACGRADHETWLSELTSHEWNWLQAYRMEFGLPEDRLRYYLAIMTYYITSALSLTGGGVTPSEVMEAMNPYRELKPRTQEGQAEFVSPRQGAALFASAVGPPEMRHG